MVLRTGNMWDEPADLVLVTTNTSVNWRNELVMGRGAAKEAAARNPGLALALGRMLKKQPKWTAYGVVLSDHVDAGTGARVGAFQVKWTWDRPAEAALIKASVYTFMDFYSGLCGPELQELFRGRVSLNFPGIGNGRLKREDVLPLVEKLPGNVTVWER